MAESIRLSSAEIVKALIAEAVLGPSPAPLRVGDITLRPHQINAVSRLRAAMDAFGGALLCDEVGMGKTFVAGAIALDYRRPLVVAPAALRTMWTEAMAKTRLRADFVSFERLSRQPLHNSSHDIVIVDEAHHARNPATRRYSALATITRDSHVLLMSATPVHNRQTDLLALLCLFLGERAKSLTEDERSRCIIRRERQSLADASVFPRIAAAMPCELPDDPGVVSDLLDIPSPVPVREGGPERHLFARGLIHQWASSEAALIEAIRRRRARAHAVIASLEAGVLPTARELATWVYGDGAVQLGFAELLSETVAEPDAMLASARDHLRELERFVGTHSPGVIDDARLAAVRAIRNAHPRSRIVAFAQYAETVNALYRRLAAMGGVALLTAKGARISSGRISREEVVSQFQPGNVETNIANPVLLLLSTDLLSEGVNLQAAQVVIHLDLPWTAARLEQRTGRVARLGSPYPTVHVYTLRPPESARRYLDSETIINSKWAAANTMIGGSKETAFGAPVECDEGQSVPVQTERLRALLEGWRSDDTAFQPDLNPLLASIESKTNGFIAALRSDERTTLLCTGASGITSELQALVETCASAIGAETSTKADTADAAIEVIEEWIRLGRASQLAGLATTSELVWRRRLLERIDSTVRTAPTHQRPRLTRLAVAARHAATRSLGTAAENELQLLERSTLPADEWLESLAHFSTNNRAQSGDHDSQPPHIIAVLLLTPPPPASECEGG